MKLIAELLASPANDNGTAPPPAGVPETTTSAPVLAGDARNDGARAAVETVVVFLPTESTVDVKRGDAEEGIAAEVLVLPILRPANDDEESPDIEALLHEDPTFAALCDEARERWIEFMDLAAESREVELDADEVQTRLEGDDDHECA